MPRARRSGAEAAPADLAERVVELAVRHGLAELEVQQGDTRVRVVREHAPAATMVAPALEAAGRESVREVGTPAAEAADNLVAVEAPMVGTFYRAPRPDAAPFVNVGDTVKEGQALCIIEAMKLMNEIEAKVAGRIAKILVENAQPVEYGQPLFLVEPRR
jgi:acetyl-CoA carboxylase biotin carboxyl carrier protein